jgi:acyl carrier protein
VTIEARTEAEDVLAHRLVEALNLEHLNASDIEPTAPLFGSQQGSLGLDSIDALEIALMVQKFYSVTLKSEDPRTIAALTSLRSLSNYVATQNGG